MFRNLTLTRSVLISIIRAILWAGVLVLLLGACSRGGPAPTQATFTPPPAETPPAVPTPSLTPFNPSPTPLPAAARVNGEEISVAQLQSELARYQAALGKELAPEDEERVLNDLIDQVLLAQAASENGFVMDEAQLEERLEQLVAKLGSEQALADWMADNGYLEADFRRDLARSIAAAWMRDQIAAAVPQAAEQVHARQILVYQREQAEEALAQLQAGQDFATLAARYNAITAGDLGWFPRGYLLDPALDEAVFSLEPGEYSSILETPTGFHIIQVIERDAERALEAEARLTLQTQALQSWLEEQRMESDIQIFDP